MVVFTIIERRGFMKLIFTKMHGCGNDYIYLNCMHTEINSPEIVAVSLCNRHTGVGADGIVLILPSDVADVKMRMFNNDGSEGNMCGNAIRCVAKYLYDNKIVVKSKMIIETRSGNRELFLDIKDNKVYFVKVNMGVPELHPKKIPAKIAGEKVIAKPILIDNEEYTITCISMGNPHAVVFCNNLEGYDLKKIGPLFENDPRFPEKINTEFVEVIDKSHLKMRVWERGSGETQACGTGSCAAAVAAVLNGYSYKGEDIKVQLLGGELIINYADEGVYMTGDCVKVFDGIVEL